jgi:hypothetical protein
MYYRWPVIDEYVQLMAWYAIADDSHQLLGNIIWYKPRKEGVDL